jgi:hypothetical protein
MFFLSLKWAGSNDLFFSGKFSAFSKKNVLSQIPFCKSAPKKERNSKSLQNFVTTMYNMKGCSKFFYFQSLDIAKFG